MTFEEFTASRTETDDIESATGGSYPTEGKRAGLIYLDGFVIERDGAGYALYIENQQFTGSDLAPLERELFDYYMGEWHDIESPAETVAPAAQPETVAAQPETVAAQFVANVATVDKTLADWIAAEIASGATMEAVQARIAAAYGVVAAERAEPVAPATMADKIKLARAFGSDMQAALSPRQFRTMCDANKAEPEDSGVCHSHDYVDANMVMLAAFEATFGREPAFLSDSNKTVDLVLWNDAWAIAKAADFFA